MVLAGVGLRPCLRLARARRDRRACRDRRAAFVIVADSRARGWRDAAQRAGQFLWTLLPALGLGYLIMGLLWPWSVQSPLNPLHAAEYFDTFFEKPWDELYEGRLIPVPDMPASYLPHLFLLNLPLLMLALGLIGTVGAIAAATRKHIAPNRRAGPDHPFVRRDLSRGAGDGAAAGAL